MDTGVIVGLILGSLIIIATIFFAFKSRDWRKESIHKWNRLPKTTARITGTNQHQSRGSEHVHGYYYTADILIDGEWQKAKGLDIFHTERVYQTGEELIVAYEPIPENKSNQILDSVMDVMTETLLNVDWEERKPRYYFQLENKDKDLGKVKLDPSAWFLIVFGLAIIAISVYYGFML